VVARRLRNLLAALLRSAARWSNRVADRLAGNGRNRPAAGPAAGPPSLEELLAMVGQPSSASTPLPSGPPDHWSRLVAHASTNGWQGKRTVPGAGTPPKRPSVARVHTVVTEETGTRTAAHKAETGDGFAPPEPVKVMPEPLPATRVAPSSAQPAAVRPPMPEPIRKVPTTGRPVAAEPGPDTTRLPLTTTKSVTAESAKTPPIPAPGQQYPKLRPTLPVASLQTTPGKRNAQDRPRNTPRLSDVDDDPVVPPDVEPPRPDRTGHEPDLSARVRPPSRSDPNPQPDLSARVRPPSRSDPNPQPDLSARVHLPSRSDPNPQPGQRPGPHTIPRPYPVSEPTSGPVSAGRETAPSRRAVPEPARRRAAMFPALPDEPPSEGLWPRLPDDAPLWTPTEQEPTGWNE
jgi:hypothetical protein